MIYPVIEIICQKPSLTLHATERLAMKHAVARAMENLSVPDDSPEEKQESREAFELLLTDYDKITEGDYEVHLMGEFPGDVPLPDPQVGDRVRIIGDHGEFFNAGDIGVLVEFGIACNLWMLNFNGMGNARVYGDGTWHCARHGFEIL